MFFLSTAFALTCADLRALRAQRVPLLQLVAAVDTLGVDRGQEACATRWFLTGSGLVIHEALEYLVDPGLIPIFENTDDPHALAQSLDALQFPMAASLWYRETIRNGVEDKDFSHALTRVANLVKVAGDPSILLSILPRIPQEAFPGAVKDTLFYYMGLHFWEKQQRLEARQLLASVSVGSDFHEQALFVKTILECQSCAGRSEVRQLSVLRQSADPNIAYLASMNLARIYYSLEHFDRALEIYMQVAPTPQRDLELGYTRLQLGYLPESNALAVPEHIEAALLQAHFFYRYEQYQEVASVFSSFEETWLPVRNQLQVQLQAATDRFVRGEDIEPDLIQLGWVDKTPWLFQALIKNQDVASLLTGMTLSLLEQQRIDMLDAPWKSRVLIGLDKHHLFLEKQATLAILNEFSRHYQDIIRVHSQLMLIYADARYWLSLPEPTFTDPR